MSTKLVIFHGLGFTPKDVVFSSIIPIYEKGALAFPKVIFLANDKDTNAKTIAIEVDQPCKIRMFVGSYEEKKK